MKATEAKLLQILQAVQQFIIPIYQRTYSWTRKECEQLWADILRAGSSDEIGVHFIGSVVYIEDGQGTITVNSPKLVIDGQQRLTTITLLLAALAEVLSQQPESGQEPFDGFSPAKIRQYYLTNTLEKGHKHFKLLLSDTDRTTLKALVEGGGAPLPPEPSIRITDNHAFFLEQLRKPTTNLAVVCRGISKLLVVDVALSRDQDNPQLIFESMNSTGRELSQADLIRNFVLMGQPPELQDRLYSHHWRPMELAFGQEAYGGSEFSAFMRDVLTLKTGEVPLLDRVYDNFKAYTRRPEVEQAGIEALLAELHTIALRYARIVLGQEPDPELQQAFHDLRELKVNVVNPLLLELYGDFDAGLIDRAELLEALRLLEAYVFRRAVCAIPSNSQQKTFATFSRALRKEPCHVLPSFKAHLLSLPSYRRFPSDGEFRRDIQERNLYKFNKSCSYWLRRLENYERKEPIAVANYTIEHILPQNPELPASWRQALGENWKALQEEWLHRLGNLTLTGYNPELSDRPFLEKRDHQGGFAHSPLVLNQGIGPLQHWGVEQMRQRGGRLAELALQVWPAPALSQEQQDLYLSSAKATNAFYSLADHPQLANPQIRAVFDALDHSIRSLDPNVYQDVLKLYIAYKCETNFVDIVSQSKRLRLSLNMPFADLDDSQGRALNVAGIGRWGNGEVELGVASLEEVPYAIGLIRQSLERQLAGNSSLD
ncbi:MULTISPECIES: DUF262 and DUF1524 domain-containing protein [unclassified Synechococcus]|uniref:DUF262 and DUF1524 domain-containing protein n=1 Tax=unclassified Synechococcus TaxID=2626047 RepID=UPI0021A85C3B|nr:MULTISPECIES: DUF262 and DUF1524 domain-containing protein [unclassified Synechococcus]MCT0212434.1 DUF262 and DUF1524 domain-containing protein [Synechococcus sp. CS-1326]MCT0234617.1 DUF262 and DUF1524 domain-containing protein [Synechococcus sp. CS-1327]